MTPESRHWGFAAILAIGLHSAVLFAAAWQPTPPGARATGRGGIEISLGAAGGAPGSIAQTTAVPAATVVPPPAAVRPVEQAAPAPAEPEPEPEPEPETVPVVDTASVAPPPVPDAATVTPAVAVAVPTPQRKPPPPKTPPPEAQPQPRAPTKPAPPVEVAEVPPETAKPVAAAPPAQRDAEVAAVSTPAGAGGVSGTQNSRNAGSGAQASAGWRVGAPPEYIDRIRAWLDRHKEYPRPARKRREEGVAYLYFVIDRTGRVLDYRLRQSSGHGSLDRATVDMIRRADPLPQMPDSIAQARLELVVPIEFQLR